MEGLNVIDYFILGIMLISILVAYTRGMITEVLSLLVWIGAIIGAALFHEDVAKMLPNILYDNPATNLADASDESNQAFTSIISFFVTFFGLLFILGIINLILSLFIRRFKINFLDRILGAAFGLLRGVLIVAFITMFVITSPLQDFSLWQESRLAPTAEEWANGLSTVVPEGFLEKINSRKILEKDPELNSLDTNTLTDPQTSPTPQAPPALPLGEEDGLIEE